MVYLLIIIPFFAAIFEAPMWAPAAWGVIAAPFVRRIGMKMAMGSEIQGGWQVMTETPGWIVAIYCIIGAYIGYLIGLGFEVAYTKLFLAP